MKLTLPYHGSSESTQSQLRKQNPVNFKQLAKWYWSPKHPTTYTLPHPKGGHPAGIGLLVKKDPSLWPAFNLCWARYDLSTWAGQEAAVMYATTAKKILERPAEGGTLGELACLLGQEGFTAYCQVHGIKLQLSLVR
jgi:hypothetical protein